MPNWVRNHLTIHGKNSVKVMKSLLVKNGSKESDYDFDFNKIIPMPPELMIESSSKTDRAIELYLTSVNPMVNYYGAEKMEANKFVILCNGLDRDCYSKKYNCKLSLSDIKKYTESFGRFNMSESAVLNLGKQVTDNFLKFGAKDWYDWSVKNWGTKWNAHNTKVPDMNKPEIYFYTAWSPVKDLMLRLSKQHPDCKFEYEFAEEQPGVYAGQCEYENGKIIANNKLPVDSKESYELYFKLWGGKEDYRFNEKKNTYEYIESESEME